MSKRLKRLVIMMEPHHYLDGAVAFRITVDADNKERFEEVKVVQEDDFNSIGSLAFDEAVNRFRRRMGWVK